jgi:hypothetical protein
MASPCQGSNFWTKQQQPQQKEEEEEDMLGGGSFPDHTQYQQLLHGCKA